MDGLAVASRCRRGGHGCCRRLSPSGIAVDDDGRRCLLHDLGGNVGRCRGHSSCRLASGWFGFGRSVAIVLKQSILLLFFFSLFSVPSFSLLHFDHLTHVLLVLKGHLDGGSPRPAAAGDAGDGEDALGLLSMIVVGSVDGLPLLLLGQEDGVDDILGLGLADALLLPGAQVVLETAGTVVVVVVLEDAFGGRRGMAGRLLHPCHSDGLDDVLGLGAEVVLLDVAVVHGLQLGGGVLLELWDGHDGDRLVEVDSSWGLVQDGVDDAIVISSFSVAAAPSSSSSEASSSSSAVGDVTEITSSAISCGL